MSRGKAAGGTVQRSPTETPFEEASSDEELRLIAEINGGTQASQPCWALFQEAMRLGHRGRARWAAERLQSLCANDPAAWSDVAAAYTDLESWGQAIHALRRAVTLGATDESTLSALANMMLADDRVDEARRVLQMLIKHHPGAGVTHLIEGHVRKAEGALHGAASSYRRAIDLKPNLADALFHLVELDDTDDRMLAARLTSALSRPDIGPTDAAALRFAMAKLDHRAARHSSAVDNWRRANGLMQRYLASKGASYDSRRHEQQVTALIGATSRVLAEPALPTLPMGMRPIFIVGMPRSGTTLVDQIIGKHPLVQQAGELPAMPACVARFRRRRAELGAGDADPWGAALDRDLLLEARENYIEQVLRRGIESEVFTDKLPSNFENVGMIRLLFPDSVIVHCRRHPVATCWSIYTTNLAGHEAYHTSMRDITSVYRQYRRLMAHWRRSGTPRLIDLDHESLVTDPTKVIPWLLDQCGLSWDDACSSFQDSPRAVVTASAAQVRRGLDSSSRTNWRAYLEYIEPEVKESLMTLADYRD